MQNQERSSRRIHDVEENNERCERSETKKKNQKKQQRIPGEEGTESLACDGVRLGLIRLAVQRDGFPP